MIIPHIETNPSALSLAPVPSIELAGIGSAGPGQGFTSVDQVHSYTATAGRYRLDRANDGFVICAANEERLCYAADGTFRGQYLQGADTYYSAPWHDVAAPHTSSDYAYFAKSNANDTVTYAGSHTEADIFGGTGGGALLTLGASGGGHFTANNVKTSSAVSGDTIRVHAIVAISSATIAGTLRLRTSTFTTFGFAHNSNGEITGYTEAWNNYRAGYHDLGSINGKRWYYLWYDLRASATGQIAPAIDFSGTLDVGKKLHVCEMMIQINPATAPAAVPVCSNGPITFAADTLKTYLVGVGYACEGLSLARSQVSGGDIYPPALPIGTPYEPLETQIALFTSAEAADRAGILPNANDTYYLRPWKTPTNFTAYLGNGYWPRNWLPQASANDAAANVVIAPVFQARRDLRPILGPHATSSTYVTGTLTVDGCVFLAAGDRVTSYWEQASIRTNNSGTFWLAARSGVNAQDCLVMGATLHSTRARWQLQDDASVGAQVYVGEFNLVTSAASATINANGSRFERLGRFAIDGGVRTNAVALDISDTAFDYIWSDGVYLTRGTFNAMARSRRFHGRSSAYVSLTLWQSRKEIEVDTGSGFGGFAASGLALSDLPHGYLAEYVGSYDFGTSTFTPGTNAAKKFRIRYWEGGSITSPVVSRSGYQWHAGQIEYDDHSRHPDQGDVYEVNDGTTKVRVYVDYGYYSSGPTWNVTTTPAVLQTGTHVDNFQVNINEVILTNSTESGCVLLNQGQGMFGNSGGGATASQMNGNRTTLQVSILQAVSNAHTFASSTVLTHSDTLDTSVFIQAADKYRFTNGSAVTMWIRSEGTNNTLVIGDNTWIATGHATGLLATGGGAITGSVGYIGLPAISAYNTFTPRTPGAVELTDLLDAADIDATSGYALPVADPWNFTFADTAAAALGFNPNAVLDVARGNHQEWDDFIAELVAVYHREPDHYAALAASTAVGTVVASGITAAAFHPRYGGNQNEYFEIDGTDLKVAKALTGLNRIFVLRGDNDETFVIDVS